MIRTNEDPQPVKRGIVRLIVAALVMLARTMFGNGGKSGGGPCAALVMLALGAALVVAGDTPHRIPRGEELPHIELIGPPEPIRVPDSELVPEIVEIHAKSQTVDWSHTALKISEAWKLAPKRGKGFKLAIVDTGMDATHPDLRERVVYSKDHTRSGSGSADVQGHGTHCGAIAGASDNDTGTVGIAPEVSLLNLKALGDSGSGSSFDIAAAIDDARLNGAHVISLSLGSPSRDDTIAGAVKRAVDSGIIVVAAAGNEGPGESTVGYPGGLAEVVCVGSSGQSGAVSRFSSRGPAMFIVAPGEQILAAYPGRRQARLSGTSMATPAIAAIAILAIERAESVGKKLTPDEFKRLLRETARDMVPPPGRDTASGFGMVDPVKLLDAIAAGDSTPPPSPVEVRFGRNHFTPEGWELVRKLNPAIDGITFNLKP